jgi:hypothetical protein
MYVFQHNGQLSIEEFHAPFGGKLDPNNRGVALASIIPWGKRSGVGTPRGELRRG